LLYRMLNGEMAELNSTAASAALQPAVWWILIGTNDYSSLCEAEQIVTGTVRIVQEILERRPGATVVVNSILPRGRKWLLGPDWYDTLTDVNRQMECYAASQKRVEFFNATDYFMEKGDDNSGRVNTTLMTDHVHPSAAGYRIWGQGIIDRVKEIKQQRRKN
jgi:lysophospholipase L1-like esterase